MKSMFSAKQNKKETKYLDIELTPTTDFQPKVPINQLLNLMGYGNAVNEREGAYITMTSIYYRALLTAEDADKDTIIRIIIYYDKYPNPSQSYTEVWKDLLADTGGDPLLMMNQRITKDRFQIIHDKYLMAFKKSTDATTEVFYRKCALQSAYREYINFEEVNLTKGALYLYILSRHSIAATSVKLTGRITYTDN